MSSRLFNRISSTSRIIISLCRNAAIMAQRLGVKCVGTNHFMPENLAPYVPVISRIKPVFNWVLWHWMRETYDRVDAVACPSGTAARILRSVGIRPPVFPISCGGNTAFFHPDPTVDRSAWRGRYGIDPQKTIFFFVGRVDREKRLDVLLRAVSLAQPGGFPIGHWRERRIPKQVDRPGRTNSGWGQRCISPGLSPRKTCHPF